MIALVPVEYLMPQRLRRMTPSGDDKDDEEELVKVDTPLIAQFEQLGHSYVAGGGGLPDSRSLRPVGASLSVLKAVPKSPSQPLLYYGSSSMEPLETIVSSPHNCQLYTDPDQQGVGGTLGEVSTDKISFQMSEMARDEGVRQGIRGGKGKSFRVAFTTPLWCVVALGSLAWP